MPHSLKYAYIVCAAAFSVIMYRPDADGADMSSWIYRSELTVTNAPKIGNSTNFPVFVLISTNRPAGFTYSDCNADGSDLRFTDAQTNELVYELELWSTSGASHAWVRISNFNANAAFLMWWGNSTASAPAYVNDGSAWSEEFTAVWHWEPPNTYIDATRAGYNCTDNGSSTSNGIMGKCRFFDGRLRDDLSVPNEAGFDFESTQPFGLSFWANSSSTSNRELVIVSKRSYTSPYSGYECASTNTGTYTFILNGSIATNFIRVAGGSTSRDGKWHHVEWTYDGSSVAAGCRLYVDGDTTPLTILKDNLNSLSILNNIALRIGQRDTLNDFSYHGHMDEVRVSSTMRSSNWVWSSYATLTYPESFISCSPAQMVLPVPIVNNSSGISGADGLEACANGFLVWTGTAPCITWFCWGDDDAAGELELWDHKVCLGGIPPGALAQNVTASEYDSVYYYRYGATNINGQSWGSPSVTWISDFNADGGPTNVIVLDTNSYRIVLGWEDRSINEDGFLVERSTNNVEWVISGSAAKDCTSFSDNFLESNTLYYFRIAATNYCHTSQYSAISARTAAVLISPENYAWDGGELANYNWSSSKNWQPDALPGRPFYLDTVLFTNVATTTDRFVASTIVDQNFLVKNMTVQNTTAMHTMQLAAGKTLTVTNSMIIGYNASGSRLSVVGIGSVHAASMVVGQADTLTGSGTLDLSSGVPDIRTETLSIGTAANSYGTVRVTAGSITCGSLSVGTALGTGRGFIQTSNAVIIVSSNVAFGPYGRMTNYVFGTNSGMDIAFADTNSIAITNMHMIFNGSMSPGATLFWGFRMSGNQVAYLNWLTNTHRITYDLSGLSQADIRNFQVFYDDIRGKTTLGVRRSGTLLLVK